MTFAAMFPDVSERQAAPQPVLENSQPMVLSPSSMNTYMVCPRLYYYRHVLRLKEPTTPAARIGSMVHRLMEVFHKTTPPPDQTHGALFCLAEALFDLDTPCEAFDNNGTSTRETLRELSSLALSELRQQVLASIDSLKAQGFFDAGVMETLAEVGYYQVAFPEIPGAVFSMQVDVFRKKTSGLSEGWEILDYKYFGQGAFKQQKPEAREKELATVLTPLPEEPFISHDTLFKDRDRRSYQLPLYWAAARQDSRFEGRIAAINDLALQIIRPAFENGDSLNGAIRVSLDGQALQKQWPQMAADIHRCFVVPIQTSKHFAPNPGNHCNNCHFNSLCDGTDS